MKSAQNFEAESSTKSSTSKSSAKKSKSRSKTIKLDTNAAAAASAKTNNAGITGSTPTTPTISNAATITNSKLSSSNSSTHENSAAALASGSSANATHADTNSSGSGSSRSHHKSYVGFEPRTVQRMWEQHDGDMELSADVCAKLSEDVSYKLLELVSNIKINARHSGGIVTTDIVNEVLSDADVPPCLGAMDSEWERIEYDGSCYFQADKYLELRDEYQREEILALDDSTYEFSCHWPFDEKNVKTFHNFLSNLIKVVLFGDEEELQQTLNDAADAAFLGCIYRALLDKIIEILAFKQADEFSARCWRLLRACAVNPCTRDVSCRIEYFHLAEILTCQLLAPTEAIKIPTLKLEMDDDAQQQTQMQMEALQPNLSDIKMEVQDIKVEAMEDEDIKPNILQQVLENSTATTNIKTEEKQQLYSSGNESAQQSEEQTKACEEEQISPYFASPVDWQYVNELCMTIGSLADISGYFRLECMFNVLRRLERFFNGRFVRTERDFRFLSRAVRCLVQLGEYCFKEFTPFIYKFSVNEMPEQLCIDYALAAAFVTSAQDIFLYEWLEHVCGDMLQPFMLSSAHELNQVRLRQHLKYKANSFEIKPKISARRLEWSALAAAMCHGDDPNKALKPKPTLKELFPELVEPNLRLNRAGHIRFKFSGCRPFSIKAKTSTTNNKAKQTVANESITDELATADVIIAKRRLLRPLRNTKLVRPTTSSYYFLKI